MTAPTAEPPTPVRAVPVSVVLVVVAASVTVAVAGLNAVQGIFAPTFFALTLVIAGRPFQKWLVRVGWPPWLAGTAVLLGLYGLLLVLVAGTGIAVAHLSTALPRYAGRFTGMWDEVLLWLEGLGVATGQIDDALDSFSVDSLVGLAGSLLDSLGAASSQVLLLVMMMFFISLDVTAGAHRWDLLRRARPLLAGALADFALRVRRYWVVSTAFGLLVAALDVVALLVLGVPMALTWGVFAFVTNYIPNIGFVIGLIPPALLALLDGDVATMVWVVVVYSVVNFTMQSVVQPKFVGDAVGLNPTVTFLSLVFWSLVVGPLGAILAVPLTLFFQAVLITADPRAHWLNAFLESGRVADAETARSATAPPAPDVIGVAPLEPDTAAGTEPVVAHALAAPPDDPAGPAPPASRTAPPPVAAPSPLGVTAADAGPAAPPPDRTDTP